MLSKKLFILATVSVFGLSAASMASASFNDYTSVTCQIESECRNDATNDDSTASGRYQMTQDSLEDAGLWKSNDDDVSRDDFGDGEWTNGEWQENEWGIESREDFMNSPEAQDYAFEQYSKQNWRALEQNGAVDYAGSTVGGMVVDDAALLAGSHLLGAEGMRNFLDSGGFYGDALANHPELRDELMKRIELYSGMDVSEATGREYEEGALARDMGADGRNVGELGDYFCDPNIAETLAESAQNTVDATAALASLEGAGFSQPPESYGYLSCLEDLLDGGVDVAFDPPTLGDILGMLEDYVCDQADQMYTEMVEAPVNEALGHATASVEGFAPIPGMGEVISGAGASVGFNRNASSDNPIDRLSVKGLGDNTTVSKPISQMSEADIEQSMETFNAVIDSFENFGESR